MAVEYRLMPRDPRFAWDDWTSFKMDELGEIELEAFRIRLGRTTRIPGKSR